MARLLFVRHAHAQIEPRHDAAAWSLSPAGRAGAQALVDRLRPFAPTRLYSSVEPKAWETAHIIARALDRPVRTAPDLHEHDRRGAPFTSGAAFTANVSRLFSDPDTLFFGNETARQALTRFARAVDTLCEAHPLESFVIATHGTVLTLFLADRCRVDPLPFWESLAQPALVVTDRPVTRILHRDPPFIERS